MLLSTIVWTNKGTATSDTDGFNANYGANASVARQNVQRAINDWQQGIVNFNYSGGGNTFNVEIRAAPISGRGVTSNITHNAGKPNSADITLDDNGDGGGWYFDQVVGSATVPDDGEFRTPISLYTADDSFTPRNDLYRTALHELAHAMGISRTSGLLINNFLTNVADDPNSSDPNDRVFSFNVGGGAAEGSFTSNGGLHSYEGPAVLGLPIHPNDLINSGRTVPIGLNRRQLISDFLLTTLQQAYGYTVLPTSQLNSFYTNFNSTTDLVTINGDLNPNGSDGDLISVTPVGSAHRFFVNGRFEDLSNSQFIAVQINAGNAGDTVNIDSLPASAPATVSGGSGDDAVIFAGSFSNLDSVAASVFLDAGAGTDIVLFEDDGSTNAFAYTINRGASTMTFSRPNSGVLTLAGTETHTINGAGGANSFNINGTLINTAWTLNGFNGNDIFNIGTVGGNAELVDGPVTINGMVGTDTFNYNDSTATGSPTYALTTTQLTRTGNGTVTYGTIESIRVDAGAGNNLLTYPNPTTSTTPPVVLSGNGGDDTFQLDYPQQAPTSGPATTVIGGAGADTLIINDALNNGGFLDFNTINTTFLNIVAGNNVNYDTLESVVWNSMSAESKAFFIMSTAAPTALTINGSNNTESFFLGGAFALFSPTTLDSLLGPITLNGNGGTDNVNINDHETSTANTYTLNSGTFTRTGVAQINYATSENVNITTGNFDDTINVLDHPAGVAVTVDGRAGLDTVNVNSDSAGLATARFAATQDLAALNIGTGGTGILTAGSSKAIDTDGLSIASGGKLDLSDNALIVDYTSSSPINTIKSLLTTGFNGGAWNGNGINSSVAATNTTHALGYAESSAIFSTFPAIFAGRPVDNTAVLARYTRYGDADLDLLVNLADFSRLAGSFGATNSLWTQGNFNFDNTTNLSDFGLLSANFGLSAAPGTAASATKRGDDLRELLNELT